MLDSILLERAGIPAISIVTDTFRETAEEMAVLWGVPGFRYVEMPHPLASLTDAQIEEHASELRDKVIELLQEGQETT